MDRDPPVIPAEDPRRKALPEGQDTEGAPARRDGKPLPPVSCIGTAFAPCGVLDAGVRILTPNEEAGRDPKSKQSLAADRRVARSMRKRRDRFLRRRDRLMETLIEHGLMPADKTERKDLEKLNHYWLRAAALRQRLELPEIGRAIFHLNQRRGFKSNRITDSDDSEDSAMKEGMKALDEKLEEAGARTLGQFLAERLRDRHGLTFRKG